MCHDIPSPENSLCLQMSGLYIYNLLDFFKSKHSCVSDCYGDA